MKLSSLLLIAPLLLSCSEQEEGIVTFTTWGEDYIELGIPAGDGGFVDGWSVEYDKFLVAFANFKVGDTSGEEAASSARQYVVDNVQPGRKTLLSFDGVVAKAWDSVGYDILPPNDEATLVGATGDDLALLIDHRYSIYIQGTASKGDVVKTFALGFDNSTRYYGCKAEAGGKTTSGIVVRNGANEVIELTTHGDHFFYDRLQGSAGASLETSLRFERIAAADRDDDGVITAEELADQRLDIDLYDPSGLPADDMLAFMTGLARTVGHFRGEGECSLTKLD